METEPIVTRYQADASQLVAELHKVRAEQGKVTGSVKETEERLKEQNAKLEESIKKWNKNAEALAGAKKATGLLLAVVGPADGALGKVLNTIGAFALGGPVAGAIAAISSFREEIFALGDAVSMLDEAFEDFEAKERVAEIANALSVTNDLLDKLNMADEGIYERQQGYATGFDKKEQEQYRRYWAQIREEEEREAEARKKRGDAESKRILDAIERETKEYMEAARKAFAARQVWVTSMLRPENAAVAGRQFGSVAGATPGQSGWGSLATDGVFDTSNKFVSGRGGELLDAEIEQLNEAVQLRAQWAAMDEGQLESGLASMFGPIEEFNAYTEAFDMLTGAVTTAMDAWITGSSSVGAAIKEFVAGSLRTLALDLAVQALKHGAYAIGSLAFGDARGAALHGKAAAMFAGAAVAAGGAAKAAYSAGWGSAVKDEQDAKKQAEKDREKTANTLGHGGSSSGGGTREIVYVYGDSFASDSPRMRARNAQETVNRVIREGGTSGAAYR